MGKLIRRTVTGQSGPMNPLAQIREAGLENQTTLPVPDQDALAAAKRRRQLRYANDSTELSQTFGP
jgi:hypothetical protein